MIDKTAIEEHIRGILIALGDNPDREGLLDTPKRVANMYAEVFEGMNYSNHEIAEMFNKIAALESKVEVLEGKMAKVEAEPAADPVEDPVEETKMSRLSYLRKQ